MFRRLEMSSPAVLQSYNWGSGECVGQIYGRELDLGIRRSYGGDWVACSCKACPCLLRFYAVGQVL